MNGSTDIDDVVNPCSADFPMKDEAGAKILIEKFGLDNILWACGGPAPSEGK